MCVAPSPREEKGRAGPGQGLQARGEGPSLSAREAPFAFDVLQSQRPSAGSASVLPPECVWLVNRVTWKQLPTGALRPSAGSGLKVMETRGVWGGSGEARTCSRRLLGPGRLHPQALCLCLFNTSRERDRLQMRAFILEHTLGSCQLRRQREASRRPALRSSRRSLLSPSLGSGGLTFLEPGCRAVGTRGTAGVGALPAQILGLQL